MSGVERLVDVGDGSPVSNGCSSPLSPDCSTILDTPLSLDFDPMSFQFQEVANPSTTQNQESSEDPEPIIIKSANYTNSSLNVFDPLVNSDLDLLPDISRVGHVERSTPSPEFNPPEILDSRPPETSAQVFCGPDLLDNPSVCNLNPDLVLIEPHDHAQYVQVDKTESFPSEDETSSSSEMIDLLDSTNEEPQPQIVETVEPLTTTITNTLTDLTASCVLETIPVAQIECSQKEDGDFHEIESSSLVDEIDGDSSYSRVVDVSLKHEELLSSDSESDSRSKVDLKKKSLTTTRKVLSTSSENSFEQTKTSKEIVTKKSSVIVEEKSLKKVNNKDYNLSKIDMNGKSESDPSSSSSSSSDEEEIPSKIECPISVTKLRTQYVMHAEQDLSTSPPKEVVLTGVDIRTLKSSYSQSSDDELTSSNKEVISTGVDIKQLKTSFTKPSEDSENYISAPVEEVKPSVDRAQVTRKFSQRGNEDDKCLCKICSKHVYQMEKVKAEKSVFHKNCFRCKECQKGLTVDAYSSHEGNIYCKPHFKQIFQPKANFGGEDIAPNTKSETEPTETEEGKQRRNEMVIRENTPQELPPDVIRCETKSNDLESLPNLNLSNIKSRFESPQEEARLPSTTDLCTLSRSPSIMARLAKYQSAVLKEGQTNGDLSAGEEDLDPDTVAVYNESKKEKIPFTGMSSLKNQWESGKVKRRDDEQEEEVKDELTKLRQRICLGRSESMKAVYEKACHDSKSPVRSESVVLGREVKALSIKDKFEKGAIDNDEEVLAEKNERLRREKEEDLSVLVEPGTAVGARSLFKQMDASIKSPSPTLLSPVRSPSMILRSSESINEADVVKCSPPVQKEEVPVETVQVSEKFKYFENFKEEAKERKRFQMTPPREPEKENSPETELTRDPNIVLCSEKEEMPVTDTAKRMLDKFKALESSSEMIPTPNTPKPLKRITPPREDPPKGSSNHQVTQERIQEQDPDIVRCSYKADEDLEVVQVDKAKSLKAMFENWESEVNRENLKNERMGGTVGGEGTEEDYLPQVDMAKNLKAKFEAIKEETGNTMEKPKPKVSRFIQEQQNAFNELCNICEKRLYPLEKMEASGMKFHKNCFRCVHCNCVLRLENFTTSAGRLFCTPHFKQLFISKGNYDEGFGREQHKEKWNRSRSSTPTPRENGEQHYTNGHVEELV